jgi:hypothetical protein
LGDLLRRKGYSTPLFTCVAEEKKEQIGTYWRWLFTMKVADNLSHHLKIPHSDLSKSDNLICLGANDGSDDWRDQGVVWQGGHQAGRQEAGGWSSLVRMSLRPAPSGCSC